MPDARVVVLTGASSGMGRADAARFAARGDAVVVSARREHVLDGAVFEPTEKGRGASGGHKDAAR